MIIIIPLAKQNTRTEYIIALKPTSVIHIKFIIAQENL